MANRNATFAKRQRETDLKDRARAKDARRAQKRNEVSGTKGPQIAWDEAVHAVTSDELPPPGEPGQSSDGSPDEAGDDADSSDAPAAATSSGPAAPRRAR